MARARRLAERILQEKKITLVPHINADVDAVASAYGLSFFLQSKGREATVYSPSIASHAKKILKKLNFEINENFEPGFVVGVDASSRDMLPVEPDLTFDHHPSNPEAIPAPSCSELVAELILENKKYNENILLLLACGIVTDTVNLSSATHETLRVLSELLKTSGANMQKVHEILEEKKEVSEIIAKLKSMRRAKIYRYGDWIFVVSNVKAFEGSCANYLLSSGADVAFILGSNRVIVRVRKSFEEETKINAFDFLERIGKNYGGHTLAAGIHTENTEALAEVIPEVFVQVMRERGLHQKVVEY